MEALLRPAVQKIIAGEEVAKGGLRIDLALTLKPKGLAQEPWKSLFRCRHIAIEFKSSRDKLVMSDFWRIINYAAGLAHNLNLDFFDEPVEALLIAARIPPAQLKKLKHHCQSPSPGIYFLEQRAIIIVCVNIDELPLSEENISLLLFCTTKRFKPLVSGLLQGSLA